MSGTIQETEERSSQEQRKAVGKVLEARSFADGEDITIRDTRVKEIIHVTQSRPVIRTEKEDGQLMLYVGRSESEHSVYYVEELRSIEPDKYSNASFNIRMHEDLLPYDWRDSNDTSLSDYFVSFFDENGVIGDTGKVYKGNSKYQVEIDVSTSFGNKTLTKEFKNKSKAQRFEEKIEEIDGFPTLSLDESASPELISENRQESSMFARLTLVDVFSIFLIGFAMFAVPVLSIIGYITGGFSMQYMIGTIIIAFLLNTLPAAFAGYGLYCLSDSDNSPSDEIFEFDSMDNAVQTIDSPAVQKTSAKTCTVTLQVKDDEVIFASKDDDIRWTFDAKDEYPSPKSIEFSECIGIEKLEQGEFSITVVPNNGHSEDRAVKSQYPSDCGMWVPMED